MDRRRRTFFQKQDGSVILETALMITVLLDADVRHGGLRPRHVHVEQPRSRPLERGRGAAPFCRRPVDDRVRVKAIVEARFNSYTFGGDTLTNANITVTDSVRIVASRPCGSRSPTPFKWITPVAAIASIIADEHRDLRLDAPRTALSTGGNRRSAGLADPARFEAKIAAPQSSSRTPPMAERRYTTIFGAALVTAALATFGIYRVLQASKAQNRVITRPVVIAFKDVAEGKAIDRASVTVAEWPINTIPAGAYASVDSVVSRVTRVDVFRGEVLVPGRLAPDGTGPGLQVKINPGKRAVSLRIDDVSGLNGMVQPNSRVDVLVVTRESKTQKDVAKTFMSNMRVLAVGTINQTTSDNRPIAATTVSLEVTPAEAERLFIAQAPGTHSALAARLRRPGFDPHDRRQLGGRPRAAPCGSCGERGPGASSSDLVRFRSPPGPGPASAGAAAGGRAATVYRRSRSQAESGRHERRHDLTKAVPRIRGSSSARIPRKPIQQSGTNRRFDPNLVPASRETFPSEPHSSFPRSCRRPQRTRIASAHRGRAGNRRRDHTHRAPRGAIATDHHAGPDHARLRGDAGNRRRCRR